jgi:hypothetical protein
MMPSVLIDSNVLLDLMTEDPRWSAWSGTLSKKRGTAFASSSIP